jgi:hypothetical protein
MIANNQKGVSLILTIFVMVILLSVILFLSLILYTEVVNVKNISDAVTAFFAADSGVEKVLYYDRKVVPSWDDGTGHNVGAARGLCTMFDPVKNPDQYCREDIPGLSSSLHCNATSIGDVNDYLTSHGLDPADYIHGCDPDVCNACQIYFDTNLGDGKTYHTTAEAVPSADGKSTDFDIKSAGYFNRSARQVEVYITSQYSQEAITIINACATPISAQEGTDIDISAEVHLNLQGDTMRSVKAFIKNSSGDHDGNVVGTIDLNFNSIYGAYTGTWTASGVGSYYVDIEVQDNQDPIIKKIQKNILPYPECVNE